MSLYEHDWQAGKTELVEGVDEIKIKYHVKGMQDALAASEISDWKQVNGVSIYLKLSAVEVFSRWGPVEQTMHLFISV